MYVPSLPRDGNISKNKPCKNDCRKRRKGGTMKKKFACEVDCANCAAKLEEAIKKVEGVEDASVNFLTQKLTLAAADEVFEEVLQEVIKVAKKVEPDTVITV